MYMIFTWLMGIAHGIISFYEDKADGMKNKKARIMAYIMFVFTPIIVPFILGILFFEYLYNKEDE